MMIKNRDPFFAQTAAPRVQVETLLDQVGSLMQVKDGARYLFGGTDYTVNPINGQLSQLPTAYAANLEIGRASCRERVCQYGEISVLAVQLKKKPNDTHTMTTRRTTSQTQEI